MNDLQSIVSRLYRFADWVQKRSRTGGIKAEREGSAPKYGAAARKVLGLDKKAPRKVSVPKGRSTKPTSPTSPSLKQLNHRAGEGSISNHELTQAIAGIFEKMTPAQANEAAKEVMTVRGAKLSKAAIVRKVTDHLQTKLFWKDREKIINEAHGLPTPDEIDQAAKVSAIPNAKQHWGTEKQPYWRPGRNPTVDNVITRDNPETGEREILLIQRATKDKKGNPVAEGGKLALPGGFWDTKAGKGESWRNDHESDDEAALRELLEETRLDASELKKAMKKVGTYETGPNAKVRRDPRDNSEAWSQSTAFRLHLTPDMAKRSIAGSDDASDAKWVPVSKIWNMKLAFDHGQIIKEALGSGSGVPFPPNLKTIKGVSDHIWELSIHGGRKKSPNDYRWDITSGDVTRTINALRSQNPSLQEIEAIARRIGVSTTNASRMGLWGPRDHKDGLIDRIEVALRGLIQGWPGPSVSRS